MSDPETGTRTVRVLVVDDSVIVRKIVSMIVDADPSLECVGVAANGSIALQLVEQHAPDVVVLDVEMPGMSGLAVLDALRGDHPDATVIMFCQHTALGASVTMQALERGAADYVTKPSQMADADAALEHVRDELVPKIRAIAGIDLPDWPAPPASQAKGRFERVDLVVVAASTGGPRALLDLIPGLPGDLPVPVIVVQHMPPMFTSQLAQRLDELSQLHVVESEDGLPIRPGQVVIATGDRHLLLTGTADNARVLGFEGDRINGVRPSADVTFSSVLSVYAGAVLGVVLTGMGRDGLNGSIAIRDSGGSVIAQNESSSVAWGMPGSVVRAGIAEEQFDIPGLAAEIVRRCAQGRT